MALHMVQEHAGQRLLPESVAQLRDLDRAACVACVTLRSRRCRRCNFCRSDTPLQDLRVGDTFSGPSTTRTSGCCSRWHARRSATSSELAASTPGDALDDSLLPNCPTRNIVFTDRDKQLLAELRRTSAMALPRCVVSRHATAWAESLEGATRGRQSLALLCRYRCRLLLAEVPKGTDRNSELKLRLRMMETAQISDLISKKLGQQHSGPRRRTTRREQPQTDEQR